MEGGMEGGNTEKWFAEDIGIYSSVSLVPHLESLQTECFYQLSAHNDLQAFHYWILSQRPQMVIIQTKQLLAATHEELQSLRNTLNTWGILTLFLAETLEEIHHWRSSLWPRVHFYLGSISEEPLKKKVLYLMNERLLLEEPSVLVLSRRPYLISHLEGVLRKYGIRLYAYPSAEENIASVLALDHPEAILCDKKLEGHVDLLETLKNGYVSPAPLPILFVGEKGEGERHAPVTVFEPQQSEKLLAHLLDVIYESRQRKLICCRDHRTGLYIKGIFFDVTEREIAIAERRREEFTILKLKLFSMPGLEKKYGSIFVAFLQTNLNYFVRNHVRASDFVAQGEGGEVLVLLSRVGHPVATLIGERLCHQFTKEASFRDNPDSFFQPSLGYEVLSYPHDFQSIKELKGMLKGAGTTEEKSILSPLSARLPVTNF